jgi:protein arginine N-methyltransferase 5
MFSWFPIYIPLRTPVHVPAGGKVEACFWRHVSRQRVWYEWALTQPQQSPIHNPNGRSYHIGL